MDDSGQSIRYPHRRLPSTNRHNPSYDVQTSRDLIPVRNHPRHSRPVNFARSRFENSLDEDEDEFGGDEDVVGDDYDDDDDADLCYDGNGRDPYDGIRNAFGSHGGSERSLKKRKMKSVMDYEAGGIGNGGGSSRNREYESRTATREWSEHETLLLLEGWGDRYLELGRKSLRSEDWKELAERVSEASGIDRTDIECRNKMDTLKKRYRKEKAKLDQFGGQCKWPCFKKMDVLLSMSPRQQSGLACGVDSGEYVFMNPRVYLNCANGLDEMRDSPGNSEDDEDDSDGADEGDDHNGGLEMSASYRYLADSIKRFGEIYENIENSKRQQMIELDKMRMDFQNEMESQKRQILEMAEAEIEKIRESDVDEDGGAENIDDVDTDASAENLSR